MMGSSFQADASISEVGGIDVGSAVRVGSGVMGENCLGFWVAVDCNCEAGAASSAISFCVGVLAGAVTDASSCTGAGVPGSAQEVTMRQRIKATTNKRFIRRSISGKN